MKSECCGAEIRNRWGVPRCSRCLDVIPYCYKPAAPTVEVCKDCGSPDVSSYCWRCEAHVETARPTADHIVDADKKVEWPTEEETFAALNAFLDGLTVTGERRTYAETGFWRALDWIRERMGVK